MADRPDPTAAAATARLPLLGTSLRLSLPYNHQPDYLDTVIAPFHEAVHDVYVPIHATACSTARPWVGPLDRDEYDQQVRALYEALQAWGIRLAITVNSPPWQPMQALNLVYEVRRLDALFPGSLFVLSDFEVALEIHRRAPGIELQPSTIARVNSATTAWYWQARTGATCVTLDRAVNKRLDVMRAIRKMGLRIRLVANDECVPGCPSEREHFTHIALHDNLSASARTPLEAEQSHCRDAITSLKDERVWLAAQKDVLPGHVRHLDGLVDYLKIAGREYRSERLAGAVRRYCEAESLAQEQGRFAYREPPEAWERLTTCDWVCDACGWCAKHIERLRPSTGCGSAGCGAPAPGPASVPPEAAAPVVAAPVVPAALRALVAPLVPGARLESGWTVGELAGADDVVRLTLKSPTGAGDLVVSVGPSAGVANAFARTAAHAIWYEVEGGGKLQSDARAVVETVVGLVRRNAP